MGHPVQELEVVPVTQIGTNFYVIIICFLKAAILLEWLRIFSPAGDRSWFYWACYGTLGFNVIWWSQSLIVINVQCNPHALIWDKTLSGTCIQEKLYDVITATLNLLMDLAILLLPQKVIWRLKLSTKRKLGLSFVFAIGLVACTSAAGRLAYTVRYWLTQDGTYEYSAVGLWSVAEMTCGILVFTTPTVPKALGAMRLGSLFTTWVKDKSNDKSDQQRGVYHDHSISFKSGQKRSGRRQDESIDTQNLVALESFDRLSSAEADLHRQVPGPCAILRTTQFALKYEDAPRSQSNEFAHQEMWA
ncbi:hypothetical protein O1611_g7753 [Lasiodiplodia mahajangana]|uniref:Uncharacterized protein n=1 Tax=Lasiodiplodia mahajangana TaxID=1108764 RepID=A0ACC2JEH8_9PEZI|nr:hypothetical protein O1611_g7753 [Lasiodiplodia mahajangana]